MDYWQKNTTSAINRKRKVNQNTTEAFQKFFKRSAKTKNQTEQ